MSGRVMSAEALAPSAEVNIPEIVVTEPSHMLQNASMTSAPIQEKAISPEKEQTAEFRTSPEKNETSICITQANPAVDQETDSHTEFSEAEGCNEFAVPVSEVAESEQAEATTDSSEIDTDEFRTTHGCCNFGSGCYGGCYEYLWNMLESRYAIPFWLIAMSVPVSAGIMAAIYMFSCPAASSLPNMVFMIGISLMAVFTLRVCIIIHRMTWLDENSRSMLQTMHLICSFVTLLFFVTESVTFWQMNPTSYSGPDFCHPTFVTYAFWWNIVASILMLLILLFPIA